MADSHRLDLRTKEFFRVGRREGKKAWVIVAGSGETLARRTRANRATAPSPTHAPSPPLSLPIPPRPSPPGATQIINFYQSSDGTNVRTDENGKSRFCVPRTVLCRFRGRVQWWRITLREQAFRVGALNVRANAAHSALSNFSNS